MRTGEERITKVRMIEDKFRTRRPCRVSNRKRLGETSGEYQLRLKKECEETEKPS